MIDRNWNINRNRNRTLRNFGPHLNRKFVWNRNHKYCRNRNRNSGSGQNFGRNRNRTEFRSITSFWRRTGVPRFVKFNWKNWSLNYLFLTFLWTFCSCFIHEGCRVQVGQSRILSIRCQFHQNFTIAFFVQKCLVSFSLITVWLCNFLAQENWQKDTLVVLMTLTPGVYFINILRATFLYKNFCSAFL